jgi:hypothetical protein
MTDGNQPRWVHPCPVCGATLLSDQGEQCAERAASADELARRQRVVAAIGTYMSKPAKPPRRWRR